MPTSQTNTTRLQAREFPELVVGSDLTLDLRDRARQSAARRPVGVQNTETLAAQSHTVLYVGDAVRPYLSTRLAVRAFDITVAFSALIVLAPLLLVVALAVRLESTGPLLFGSPRLGHKKPVFTAWKFRSMYPDADIQLQRLLERDADAAMEYYTFHKLQNDPRITKVGRFIRRTSLDELPQLFNILIGDMSVVGPRPNLLKEAELFREALPVVLQVRPGLTGLWQVSGRNRLPVQERVVLDIDYARNRTMFGDLVICMRTFLQLWRPGKHGAY